MHSASSATRDSIQPRSATLSSSTVGFCSMHSHDVSASFPS
jgi:hypothetical protein